MQIAANLQEFGTKQEAREVQVIKRSSIRAHLWGKVTCDSRRVLVKLGGAAKPGTLIPAGELSDEPQAQQTGVELNLNRYQRTHR